MTPEQWYKEANNKIEALENLRHMERRQRNEIYGLQACVEGYERIKSRWTTSGLMSEHDPRYKAIVEKAFKDYHCGEPSPSSKPIVELADGGYWVTDTDWNVDLDDPLFEPDVEHLT